MKTRDSILLILGSILVANLDWILAPFLKLKLGAAFAQSSPIAQIYDINGNLIYKKNGYSRREIVRKDSFLYSGDILESVGAGITIICQSGRIITDIIASGVKWNVEQSCLGRRDNSIHVPSEIRHNIQSPTYLNPIVSFPTPPSISLHPDIENIIFNLRRSDRNSIAQLQNNLWRYNYYRGGDEPGYFGFATETAVRQFLQAGGKIYYSLTPPQNNFFPPTFPDNQSNFNLDSQTFYLLIPIHPSKFTQRTQQVSTLIPDREIEISGLENNFGFFIKVGLITSRNDANYYQQFLQNQLGIYGISIYEDR
ncbi:MAG: peptidoglycan-binding protein [Spirulina sp.]